MGNQRIGPVSPILLLSLWRERWGKASSAGARVPYNNGKLARWGSRLTDHAVWSRSGVVGITLLCCAALFLLTMDVPLTISGQIIFSVGLMGTALYLRRCEGMLMTLMLASLSVIASARYFNWRFSSVLNLDHTLIAVLALCLCLAELYVWVVTTLGFVTTVWPLKRGSAELGVVASKTPDILAVNESKKQPHEQTTDAFLVNDSSSPSSLHWQQRLKSLQDRLGFYALLPRIIFFTAPLVYLIGGLDVIQVAPEVLLAYFLPHTVHAYFVWARLNHKSRLPLWMEFKETALAWYFLFPTGFSFLRTKIFNIKNFFSAKKTIQTEGFDRLLAWPLGVILGLNLIGVLIGFQQLSNADRLQASTHFLYLVWALYNLMLLLAAFAVAEESRQIRQHIQQQRQHQAMLQLPSGRTMTGVTENFPNLTLSVRLPAQAKLEVGTVIGLSIFRALREFTFSTRIAFNDDHRLELVILEKSKDDYQALGILALTRDERWPQWLPGPTADQPLPQWISQPLWKAFVKVSTSVGKWGLVDKLSRLTSWIKYWEKAT